MAEGSLNLGSPPAPPAAAPVAVVEAGVGVEGTFEVAGAVCCWGAAGAAGVETGWAGVAGGAAFGAGAALGYVMSVRAGED